MLFNPIVIGNKPKQERKIMNTHADKTKENKSQSVSAVNSQMQSGGESTFQFEDNRSEAIQMRKLQELANKRAGKMALPIQRKVYSTVSTNDENKTAVDQYEIGLNNATQRAFDIVFSEPLKDNQLIDGYTQLWSEQIQKYKQGKLKTGESQLLNANAGYAIESLATKVLAPAPGGGLTADLQSPRGNTRPDVILSKADEDIAWLDLTAEKSRGHIDLKNSTGWKSKPHVAEITYPSIAIPLLVKTHQDPTITAENTDNLVETYTALKARFEAESADYKTEVLKICELIRDDEEWQHKSKRKNLTVKYFHKHISEDLKPMEVAAMLAFAGQSLVTYKFKYSGIVSAMSGRVLLGELIDLVNEEESKKSKLQVATEYVSALSMPQKLMLIVVFILLAASVWKLFYGSESAGPSGLSFDRDL